MAKKKSKKNRGEVSGGIITLAGLGLGAYLLYKTLSGNGGGGCNEGEVVTQKCPDETSIVTQVCVNGKLTPTGNECSTPEPKAQIINFEVLSEIQARVRVQNIGTVASTFYIGASKGLDVGGSGCNSGLGIVIWDLSTPKWIPLTLQPWESDYITLSLPTPKFDDEKLVVKVWSKRIDPVVDSTNKCLAGDWRDCGLIVDTTPKAQITSVSIMERNTTSGYVVLRVYVKNVGNISNNYSLGFTECRGVSGSGCNIGTGYVLHDLPLEDWTTTMQLEPGNVIAVDQTMPYFNLADEYCIVKVYYQRSSDPIYCLDGKYVKV